MSTDTTYSPDEAVMALLIAGLGNHAERAEANARLRELDEHRPAHTIDDDNAQDLQRAMWRAQAAQQAAERLRANREGQRLLDAENAAGALAALPGVVLLPDALAAPVEPTRYRIDGLLPDGGNATIAAIRKTGKTVTVLNVVRSLADGVPFLGAHDVRPLNGRVIVCNYELTDRQQTAWFRDLDAEHPERVGMINLRGHRVPLMTDHGAEWLADTLRRADAEVAVIDPAGRAFVSAGGVDENSNSEVLRFLARLDEIKTAAGVSELLLPIHGHRGAQAGGERSRGASAWEDWPDAVWRLARNEDDHRFFSAYGRDVEVPERRLAFAPTTRRLTVDGGSRRAEETEPARLAALDVVERSGEVGVTKNALEQILDGHGRNKVRNAVKALVAAGTITETPGARNAKVLHLATSPPPGELGTGEVARTSPPRPIGGEVLGEVHSPGARHHSSTGPDHEERPLNTWRRGGGKA